MNQSIQHLICPRWLRRLLRILPTTAFLLAASPATAQAQPAEDPPPAGPFRAGQFMLPIDLSQALITDRSGPLPWTVSLRAYPMFALDSDACWRAGAATALTYRNPGWEVLAGARLSYRLKTFGLAENGMDLSPEGLLGTNGGDEVALAWTVDLARLFRLGLRGARDVTRDEFLFEMTIGTDPLKLIPLLSGKRIEEDFEE